MQVHHPWALFTRCWRSGALHTVGCKPGSPCSPTDTRDGKTRATSLLQVGVQASC